MLFRLHLFINNLAAVLEFLASVQEVFLELMICYCRISTAAMTDPSNTPGKNGLNG